MLVAMATGTGKTKLAIALLYRLLAAKRFRRICFVVDRSALGQQTEDEFTTTKVVSRQGLRRHLRPEGLGGRDARDAKQGPHLHHPGAGEACALSPPMPSEAPPVDQYDLMVVDECHRGYLLDREMSDAELSFRGQDDYISKYRRVLEYFDAVKIGLTATPALHTTEIFGEPIFTYSYREAVIDGYLIDHEPPVRIETALARAGIVFAEGEQVELLHARDRRVRPAQLPDEIEFEVEQFNRQVITEPFNRAVAEELARHIDPAPAGQDPDLRRDRRPRRHRGEGNARRRSRKAYGEIDDAAVKKITGSVDEVGKLIRLFRNDADPEDRRHGRSAHHRHRRAVASPTSCSCGGSTAASSTSR